MTTYTTNLDIPHLDQNVAQPEIPENVAKNIIDVIFAGNYTTDLVLDADYTYPYTPSPTLAQDWHNYMQKFTDDTIVLTSTRVITFPNNSRPYILYNGTLQTLEFKIVSQVLANVSLLTGAYVYVYSDGINLIKIPF